MAGLGSLANLEFGNKPCYGTCTIFRSLEGMLGYSNMLFYVKLDYQYFTLNHETVYCIRIKKRKRINGKIMLMISLIRAIPCQKSEKKGLHQKEGLL